MGDETEDDDSQFPREDVEAARINVELQARKAVDTNRIASLPDLKPGPNCKATGPELAWFYFESPKWTWENLRGRAGLMSVCDRCHIQVEFRMTTMN
jgi:hypothetical protein